LAAVCEEAVDVEVEVLESAAAAWAASVLVDGAGVVVAGVVVAAAGVVVAAAGVVVPGVVVAAAGVVVSGPVVAAAGVLVELPVEELLGTVVEELEAGAEVPFEDDCTGISSAKKVVVVVVPADADEDPEDKGDCAAFSWDQVIDPVLFVSMAAKADAAWALLEP
jgi:hypothetical protein